MGNSCCSTSSSPSDDVDPSSQSRHPTIQPDNRKSAVATNTRVPPPPPRNYKQISIELSHSDMLLIEGVVNSYFSITNGEGDPVAVSSLADASPEIQAKFHLNNVIVRAAQKIISPKRRSSSSHQNQATSTTAPFDSKLASRITGDILLRPSQTNNETNNQGNNNGNDNKITTTTIADKSVIELIRQTKAKIFEEVINTIFESSSSSPTSSHNNIILRDQLPPAVQQAIDATVETEIQSILEQNREMIMNAAYGVGEPPNENFSHFDMESHMYWSEADQLYFDPECNQFFEPKTQKWFNEKTQNWEDSPLNNTSSGSNGNNNQNNNNNNIVAVIQDENENNVSLTKIDNTYNNHMSPASSSSMPALSPSSSSSPPSLASSPIKNIATTTTTITSGNDENYHETNNSNNNERRPESVGLTEDFVWFHETKIWYSHTQKMYFDENFMSYYCDEHGWYDAEKGEWEK